MRGRILVLVFASLVGIGHGISEASDRVDEVNPSLRSGDVLFGAGVALVATGLVMEFRKPHYEQWIGSGSDRELLAGTVDMHVEAYWIAGAALIILGRISEIRGEAGRDADEHSVACALVERHEIVRACSVGGSPGVAISLSF